LILNNAPQHEAVLSNVGEIGEFRIRNSAKAFNILSSGLYANKIRAIIRELSCNAVDSHTAAGQQEVPFDVHLPNQLDPTFRIRDYGTGLSHEQVLNIYTTYFESTKTESNQFIGALGLGSKSPFSYTDNFTVTAIKDGTRNVYSAFINGEGVPSVALMHSESTTESNGVEVQFAVTDRWDFDKFYSEAREVYTYFALRPNVSGGEREFNFRDVEYKDRNIIPGVHYVGRGGSRAIMGNISYPIDVPNAETNLDELRRLLGCGLEMHFDIGELDFQASREGLSYIPSTIEAIKQKLIALNAQLAVHLEMEASAITNDWEKVYFLQKKVHEDLWAGATRAYITAKQPPMMDYTNLHYVRAQAPKIEVKELASRYNISILAFNKTRHSVTCHEIKPHKDFTDRALSQYEESWQFSVDAGTIFVKNDLKVGALTRAKYHWRHAASKGVKLPSEGYSHNVYVLSPATKGHAMDTVGFFAALNMPPENQIVKASDLIEKERKVSSGNRAKDVRIVRLERKDYGRRGYENLVWGEAGRADQYDTSKNYYYIPLSGYTAIDCKMDPKTLQDKMANSGIPALAVDVYGVRKGDIEFIRTQKNWIPLETHVSAVLNNLSATDLGNLALNEIDNGALFRYNKTIAHNINNRNSAYLALISKFENLSKVRYSKHALEYLFKTYAPGVGVQPTIDALVAELDAVKRRYPLLDSIRDYAIPELAVAQYINLIDNSKGN
jgi:hypothetical protein